MSSLSRAEYGKANVRVFRIVRDGKWHHVVEYNVTVLLQGDISTSYTQADNSVVVATDSGVYLKFYIAKISPHILSPEKFALHLGTFIVSKYGHIEKADVRVEQLRWKRISVSGNENGKEGKEGGEVEHEHAFWRDGEEKRIVNVVVDKRKEKDTLIASVSAGISDLLVLKSTGSSFTDFIQDEFTTLIPVNDRIFSTSIDLTYTFQDISIPLPKEEKKKVEFEVVVREGGEGYKGSVWDEGVFERARKATVEVFANDESASVQATLFKMGQRIIEENGGIREVRYALPNKHYIPVNMEYIGIDNLTPCVAKAEVFCPIGAPSGLISATISRK
ncbi:hypothetical protein AGABI1DRAFT_42333 [Agaricus bisporus var. burnettii JB137-S8]|uniref:Uricase n=1 Tax=Agaricus bisporus var. burnettii (strain JB137-S8 / ATCC MYA-4627 / FGSC 10392) TaxID=597362 RepID=K5X4N4_AGABU|nr:uncharacterized protein AGABI1DRAFT_42333 [Agaricus bisporus var. burnettii JB137-S8]EKM77907.1 hypothetical protein AGABI1DRAFT_42333 [Agaricus bisporus var. burnettii JB137-S8]